MKEKKHRPLTKEGPRRHGRTCKDSEKEKTKRAAGWVLLSRKTKGRVQQAGTGKFEET